jgi:hypothetical protein
VCESDFKHHETLSVMYWSTCSHRVRYIVGSIKNGICCLSTKNVALKRKNKEWLARNQDNVSEWNDMSIRGLLFQ